MPSHFRRGGCRLVVVWSHGCGFVVGLLGLEGIVHGVLCLLIRVFWSSAQRQQHVMSRLTALSVKAHTSNLTVSANPRHLLNARLSCFQFLKCLNLLWRTMQTLPVARRRTSPVTPGLSFPFLHCLSQPFWTSSYGRGRKEAQFQCALCSGDFVKTRHDNTCSGKNDQPINRLGTKADCGAFKMEACGDTTMST